MKSQTFDFELSQIQWKGRKNGSKLHLSFREKKLLFRNLSRMLRGGLSLLHTLETLSAGSRSQTTRGVLTKISDGIRSGTTFSQALAFRPHLFSPFEMEIIRAGEMSGNLEKVLWDLAQEMEETEKWRSKLQEALAYPCFVLLFGLITLGFLLVYVVPQMSALYSDFDAALPFLTRLVIQTSAWAPFLIFLLVSVLVIFFLLFKYRRRRLQEILERMPVMGSFLKDYRVIWFSSLLSLLLQSGVTLFQSLSALSDTESLTLRKDLEGLRDHLREGVSFSDSLRDLDWLKEQTRVLILAGEESGNLPECLHEIAETYRYEFENQKNLWLKWVEPVLILVLGTLTGLLVIAMLLPILSLSFYVR